jgi:hypothetical protein
VLAFAAAFLVGTLVAGQSTDDIIAGFPSDLFLTLVGITYLFAVAQNNGTVDWLVELAVRAVRGRVGAVPWIMFALAAVLTAVGAVSPGAVAIIAPIALGDQHLRRHHQRGHEGGRAAPQRDRHLPGQPVRQPGGGRAALHGPGRPRPAAAAGRGDRGAGRRFVPSFRGRHRGEPARIGGRLPRPRDLPQRAAQAHGDAEMEARTEERELEQRPQEAPEAAPEEQPQPSRSYQLLTVAGILTLPR